MINKGLMHNVERGREWVENCQGEFASFVFAKELGIESPEDRDLVLSDLQSLGLIEPSGDKHGRYRKVRTDCPVIEWETATADWYPILLPLGLDKMCGTRRKNIIIVAGETNAGKTWFVLKAAHMNLKQNGGAHERIDYFNSEMGPDELRSRLLGIDDNKENWRGMRTFERSNDFHAVIRPDGLNIIDYLEVSDKFYLVASMIQRIHERLTTGVAVICLQKPKGKDSGRGGDFTLEKARLALALSYAHGVNICKIVKCKNPMRGNQNPQGQEIDYRLHRGSYSEEINPGWRWVNEKERKSLLTAYEQEQTSSRFRDKWRESEF